jgi:hypothetical protein
VLGNDPDSHNSSALASKAILSSNRWPAARFGNAIIGTVYRPNNVTDDFQENSVKSARRTWFCSWLLDWATLSSYARCHEGSSRLVCAYSPFLARSSMWRKAKTIPPHLVKELTKQEIGCDVRYTASPRPNK